MLSVMIVDDEVLARIGVKSLIPWTDNDFDLVAECDNGQDAYDMAMKLQPDIIISDVKMPLMNGIELMQALKRDGIHSKFVMLSAYDDYELVRTAMKEGADDYILKLKMEPKDVINILTEIGKKIEKQKNIQDNKQDRSIQNKDYREQDRNSLFNDICFGILKNEKAIAEVVESSRLNLKSNNLACVIVKIDESQEEMRQRDDFFKMTMSDVLLECVRNYGDGHVVFHEPDRFVVGCSLSERYNKEKLTKALEHMSMSMLELITNMMNIRVVIGLSDIHKGYDSISKAYCEAMEATYSSIAFLGGSIIRYKDAVNRQISHSDIKVDGEMTALAVAMKNNDIDMIKKGMQQLILDLKESSGLTENYLVGQCHVLIFLVSEYISNNRMPAEQVWGIEINPYHAISVFKVKQEYIDWISSACKHLLKLLDKMDESNIIIIRAKQYVFMNIDKNISLSDIAEFIGLSSSYFSRLFSEVTGQRFIDYVTKEKIAIAMEMIRSTSLKIYEIADNVGYENVHYFSRVFRKTTGVSPMEYKSGKHSKLQRSE